MITEKATIHIADTWVDIGYLDGSRSGFGRRSRRYSYAVAVPMLKENELIGLITCSAGSTPLHRKTN